MEFILRKIIIDVYKEIFFLMIIGFLVIKIFVWVVDKKLCIFEENIFIDWLGSFV